MCDIIDLFIGVLSIALLPTARCLDTTAVDDNNGRLFPIIARPVGRFSIEELLTAGT